MMGSATNVVMLRKSAIKHNMGTPVMRGICSTPQVQGELIKQIQRSHQKFTPFLRLSCAGWSTPFRPGREDAAVHVEPAISQNPVRTALQVWKVEQTVQFPTIEDSK